MRGTVALVFEDLHWADPGTLAFIEHLLDWSRGVPLFIVTLARPELLDKRPDWASSRRNFGSIALDPLPEPMMRELLEGLAPGLPKEPVGLIVQRADGVPLYAVETVRMLVADGKLELSEADGTYHPTADLTELAVPETLAALIAARLDGLSPTERKLVSDAAVLGQSFTLAALASVAGVPDIELHLLLQTLIRREILVLAVDPRSPERGQYAFVQ
ncbi:MAG: adenylate/guanylate cyclase domain-containing protein, partial [Candidatus Limnocylindrales bacterium]